MPHVFVVFRAEDDIALAVSYDEGDSRSSAD